MAWDLNRLLSRRSVRIGGIVAVIGGALGGLANFSALVDLVSPDETRQIVAGAAETLTETDAKVNELLKLMRNRAAFEGAGLNPHSEETIKLALEAILTSSDARKAVARAALEAGEVAEAANAMRGLAIEQECAAGTAAQAAAESWRELAVLTDYSKPEETIAALERADQLEPGHGGGLLHLAAVRYRIGALSAAEADARRVLDISGVQPAERAEAHRWIGRVAQARGAFDEAAQAYAHGLGLITPDSAPLLYVGIMVDQAIIRRVRGDLDAARRDLDVALELARSIEAPSATALVLSNMAVNARRRDDPDRAEALLNEALGLYRSQENLFGEALAAGNLGGLAIERGDFETAERYIGRSAEIGETLQLKDSLAYDYNNLGDMALRRGDFDTAQAHLDRSLALTEELGLVSLRPYVTITMGELDLARGDTAEGCRRLASARAALAALEDANQSVAHEMMADAGCGAPSR
ncbi:MAG: tetratricopeptide repeat protein [Pseudomonadota bacterium]